MKQQDRRGGNMFIRNLARDGIYGLRLWRLHIRRPSETGKLGRSDASLSSLPPFIIFYRITTSSVVRFSLHLVSTYFSAEKGRIVVDCSGGKTGTCVSPYCASCVHLEKKKKKGEDDFRWDKSSLRYLSPCPSYITFLHIRTRIERLNLKAHHPRRTSFSLFSQSSTSTAISLTNTTLPFHLTTIYRALFVRSRA